jgi:hypothetical protein
MRELNRLGVTGVIDAGGGSQIYYLGTKVSHGIDWRSS